MTSSRKPERHQPQFSMFRYASAPAVEDSDAQCQSQLQKRVGGISIREIRQAMPQSPSSGSRSPSTMAPLQSQGPSSNPQHHPKKRRSLLGGFFIKEPSMVAFDQVVAQILPHRDPTKSVQTPSVRPQRMPSHVPKVNSKWDGIPQSVKVRERIQKDGKRSATQLHGHTRRRSRSAEQSRSHQTQWRGSHSESWDSWSTDPQLGPKSLRSRSSSSYSTRSECSCQSSSQNRTDRTSSYGPPPSSNLPEITAFFPHGIQAHSRSSEINSGPQTSRSQDLNWYKRSSSIPEQILLSPNVELFQEHGEFSTPQSPKSASIVSPTTTPGPVNQSNKHLEPNRLSLLVDTAALSKSTSHAIRESGAFLAGEARPLEMSHEEGKEHISSLSSGYMATKVARLQTDIEKRPQSSRVRLGLRASMVIRTDAAPWDYSSSPAASARRLDSPRSKLRFFSKDKS